MLLQPAFEIERKGFEDLTRRLNAMEAKMRTKIVRAAVGKVAAPMVKKMRDKIKEMGVFDTGTLHASIGKKTIINKRVGNAAAIIGPRYRFQSKKLERTGGNRLKTMTGFTASRYAHFPEGGYAGKMKVEPRPFVKETIEENDKWFFDRLADELRVQIIKSVGK